LKLLLESLAPAINDNTPEHAGLNKPPLNLSFIYSDEKND